MVIYDIKFSYKKLKTTIVFKLFPKIDINIGGVFKVLCK